jgi:2-dehydropantoate 2-reductase
MVIMSYIQRKVWLILVCRPSYVNRPRAVVKTPAEAGETYDYVVCAHKAINQGSAAKQLAPAVDENKTCIVLIQNGVGNEDPFRDAFPKCTILSCVVCKSHGGSCCSLMRWQTWVGASQDTPGIVNHWKNEGTEIGIFPNPGLDAASERARLDEFTSLLRDGNTPFSVEDNVQIQRWSKVIWNCAWNSLTTLTMLDTHSWLKSSPDSTPMTRKLMQEVIDVARACDVPLKDDLIDTQVDKILAMQPIGSSMQTDCKMGRPMEVEIILGTPVRKGRELNVSTPILEVLYTLLLAINTRMKPAS